MTNYKICYKICCSKGSNIMRKKNKKMIIVVASLLLVVGVSFAYFVATAIFSGEGTKYKWNKLQQYREAY